MYHLFALSHSQLTVISIPTLELLKVMLRLKLTLASRPIFLAALASSRLSEADAKAGPPERLF